MASLSSSYADFVLGLRYDHLKPDVIAQTKIHQVFDREVHFELFREDQKPPFNDLCEGLRSGV